MTDADATDRSRSELAAGESDGIHVVALRQPVDDGLTLTVKDARAGGRFQLSVARGGLLELVNRSFAYAA